MKRPDGGKTRRSHAAGISRTTSVGLPKHFPAPFRLVRLIVLQKIHVIFMIHRRARFDLCGARGVNGDVVIFEPPAAPKKKRQGLEGHHHDRHQQTRFRKKHPRFMDVLLLARFYVLDRRRGVRLVRLGPSEREKVKGGRLVLKAHQD